MRDIVKYMTYFLIGSVVVFGTYIFITNTNLFARHYGGKTSVTLPAGEKFINSTWDSGGNLWYITRPMKNGEEAETYTMHEDSNMGMLQGTVIIREQK